MQEKVFDLLRKKYVALTPEERVRQMVINWLHVNKGYPLSLMQSEYAFTFNKMEFRSDIVIFNKRGAIEVVVECKARDVEISNATLEQIIRYNSVLKGRYLMVTNGIKTFFIEAVSTTPSPKNSAANSVEDYSGDIGSRVEYIAIKELPAY